jgi:hypothetical protein
MLRYRIAIAGTLLLAASCAQANPLGLMLTRLHDPVYAPGMPMEIVVTIEAASLEGLLAMGLYETLPEGWRFEGVHGGADGLPAIMPAPGDGPHLEFAWITPPPMPCSFSYTVTPQADSWGSREIHGVLEYRMREGPYYLPDRVTVLDGPEETKPTLILRGAQLMEVMQGDTWEEPGYTALDTRLQDISSRVVVTGEVQTETPGTYTIRYGITSESGTQATEVQRIVRVLERKEAAPETPVASGRSLPIMPLEKKKQALPSADNVINVPRAESTEVQVKKRAALQFPDLSLFRPVLPGEYEEEEQTGVAEGNANTFSPVSEEDVEKAVEAGSGLAAKGTASDKDTSGNGDGKNAVKEEKQGFSGYLLPGLTGVALLGLMAGAWFGFRSRGRRMSHLQGKKKWTKSRDNRK